MVIATGTGAAETDRENVVEAVCGVAAQESATRTVGEKDPLAVGVPVKAPVVDNAKPAGNDPEVSVHV